VSTPRGWLEDRVTISTPEGVDLDVVVAGIGSRFVARLLDTLIQGAIIVALAIVLGVANALDDGPGVAAFSIVGFLVLFVYDPLLEQTRNGATPGKSASGLRVVMREGAPVTLSASVVRNVVRIVDFLPGFYGIGFVTMLATRHSERLGDLAAGTIVVRERLGDTRDVALQQLSAITVRPDDVAHWDVSAVTPQELAVVRQFLARRLSLTPEVRYRTGVDLAMRLATKVTGLPPTSHPEYVLEGIVVAKDMRG
jgi:uncharacterized RDD family membrane protein YckC